MRIVPTKMSTLRAPSKRSDAVRDEITCARRKVKLGVGRPLDVKIEPTEIIEGPVLFKAHRLKWSERIAKQASLFQKRAFHLSTRETETASLTLSAFFFSDLRQKAVKVRVRRPLDVQVPAANIWQCIQFCGFGIFGNVTSTADFLSVANGHACIPFRYSC